MSSPSREMTIPARPLRDRPAYRLVPVILGLLSEVLMIPVLEMALPFRHLLFPFLGFRGIAAMFVLSMFSAPFLSVCIASSIFGLKVDFSVATRTALAGLWIAPFLFCFHIRSWLTIVVWFILVVEFSRLIAFVTRPSGTSPVEEHEALLRDLSFQPIHSSWALDFNSILSSFLLQGAVYLAISSQWLFASLTFFVATLALVRRGARMLLDSPNLKSFNLAKRAPVVMCMVTLLLIFILLPRGGSGDHAANAQGAFAAHAAKPTNGHTMPLVTGDIFPGVLLYPEVQKHTKLIAPPQASGEGVSKSDKPYVIPFDGVYWVWRPPDVHPPTTAILKYGSPTELGFRSTDLSPLWMEAHQELGTHVELTCCTAIEVVIENADLLPQTIKMELVADNAESPGGAIQSLGIQPIPTTEQKIPEPPLQQTLLFSIPNHTNIQNFDELIVRFRLGLWRSSKSAKIAVKQFVLIPRP